MALGDGEATGGCWTPEVLLVDCELRDEVEIADLMTKHQRLSSHHILAWQDEEETMDQWENTFEFCTHLQIQIPVEI